MVPVLGQLLFCFKVSMKDLGSLQVQRLLAVIEYGLLELLNLLIHLVLKF